MDASPFRLRVLTLLGFVLALASCGPRTQIPAPDNVASPPVDAQVTETGLTYIVLKQGTGPIPRKTDEVLVHYTGWTVDGSMFDSSVAKGKPAKFVVGDLIPGWTEALVMMHSGSKYRLWVPEPLAYRGKEGFPAGTLVFDLQLISVE